MSLLCETFGKRLLSTALFGSRARGDALADSDLDLVLILAERQPMDYGARLEPSMTSGRGGTRK